MRLRIEHNYWVAIIHIENFELAHNSRILTHWIENDAGYGIAWRRLFLFRKFDDERHVIFSFQFHLVGRICDHKILLLVPIENNNFRAPMKTIVLELSFLLRHKTRFQFKVVYLWNIRIVSVCFSFIGFTLRWRMFVYRGSGRKFYL